MKACPYCAEQIQDAATFCRFCQHNLTTGELAAKQTVVVQPAPQWNKGVAAVLSLVIPGAGQMYKGEVGAGLAWLFFTILGYLAYILPGIILHLICIGSAASGDPNPKPEKPESSVFQGKPYVGPTPQERAKSRRQMAYIFAGLVLFGGIVVTMDRFAKPTARSSTPPVVAAPVARSSTPPVVAAPVAGCQPHIETHGAAFWAKELGRSETWVLQNHKINLWEGDGPQRGKIVGSLIPGSRAVVLAESVTAYRVRSPQDQSVGLISKDHVARTLHQDVDSRQPCDRSTMALEVERLPNAEPPAKSAAAAAPVRDRRDPPEKVWVFKGPDEKYHLTGCRVIGSGGTMLSLKDADGKLEPCEICKPPTLKTYMQTR
jgi:TM2 domain-containing membrane protein YozV